MNPLELPEVQQFLSEVHTRDTLTMVIRAHLYAENKINAMIESLVPKPKALARIRTFALKLSLVQALGLSRVSVQRSSSNC